MKRNKFVSLSLALTMALSCVLSSNVYAKKYYANASSARTTGSSLGVGTGSYPKLAEGQAMTVDMATQRAIDTSTTLQTYEDNIDIIDDNMADVRVYRKVAEPYVSYTGYAIQYKQLENQLQQYKDRIEVTKETYRFQVETYFVNIINAQNKLAIYDELLDISKRSLDISTKQYELGMMSKTEYDTAVDNYNSVVTGKTALEKNIESNYSSLNTLLHYNVAAIYPVELDEIEYEAVNPVTLDAQVALATSSSNLNIKILEDSVEVAKYTEDLHSDLYSTESKLEAQSNVYTATSTLNNTKLSYEAAVKTLYDGIVVTENNYKDLNDQLNTLKNTMSVYEKQFDLGQITQLQLDTYRYNLKDLENQVEESLYSHYLLVRQYENPNLLSS